MDALVQNAGRGGTTSRESVLETSLCGILYVDHTRVVSHSPEKL